LNRKKVNMPLREDNVLFSATKLTPLVVACLLLAIVSLAKAQQTGDANLVDQYFPQRLIDESVNDFNTGGPPPFQTSNFVAADLDGAGTAQYLVAAYTNGFSAVVRVIKKQGATASVVAEPSLPLMGGVDSFVALLDLDGDGRPEVVVTLTSASGFGGDWIFKWDGRNLNSIGPSEVGADGNVATLLGDAVFVDLSGKGLLDIVNPPEPIGRLADTPSSDPFTVFALSGGTYGSTPKTLNYFETFVRREGAPVTVTRSFSIANSNIAYVMTVAKGDDGGGRDCDGRDLHSGGRNGDDRGRHGGGRDCNDRDHHGDDRLSFAEVYLNGYQVVGPSTFKQQAQVLKIPISVTTSNTLVVTLKSAPGSQLTIGIGPQ
jgi:hypothetical protein